ncbi:MAG: site-2 protease family protein [Candidatus Aenigmarchaeota archaeon]|nr:site-2 protease family protein [Candidatus Aenigmarchaeota archaeon]
MAAFVAQYFWYAFLIVFLVGTALLTRTKFQRSYIIFLMKTRRGIGFLDRLARLAPGAWTFLADFSVLVSFGGLGATYISRHRRPWPFLLVLGILTLVFLLPVVGPVWTGVFAVLLLGAIAIAERLRATAGYFLLGAVVMAGAVLGLLGGVSAPAAVIAAITGAVGIPGLLVSFLAVQAGQIVFAQSTVPGVSPLLPGVSAAGEIGFVFPGLNIFIPLWSGLIAIIILLVSHEFSHGILARVHGIRVRSMGLLTFGIIPIGAFVEPDEKHLATKRSEQKMHVYAMGSFANLIVAGLCVLLVVPASLSLAGLVMPAGVQVETIQDGYPAAALEPGTVIWAVNGVNVSTVDAYVAQVANLTPGDAIVLDTDRGRFSLVSVAPPDGSPRGYLGFTLQTKTVPVHAGQEGLVAFLLFVLSTLNIVFLFNLNIAIVNLLPVLPFDGSKMFEELMQSFGLGKGHRQAIAKAIVLLVVALLILNALPLGSLAAAALGG